MRNMKNNQSGFTLIELVMVIVILGILSAFALPRFADLTGDARTASIEGLAGALKSAAAIAHAQQVADGTSVDTAVTLESVSIAMVSGYPTAQSAAGIGLAANVDSNDYSATGGAATAGSSVVFQINGYTPATAGTCQVTYQAANAATPTSYSVTTVVSGC